jgi:hypothetical protein
LQDELKRVLIAIQKPAPAADVHWPRFVERRLPSHADAMRSERFNGPRDIQRLVFQV